MNNRNLASFFLVGILLTGLVLAGCTSSNSQTNTGGSQQQTSGNSQVQGQINSIPTIDNSNSGMPSIDENPGFNDSQIN